MQAKYVVWNCATRGRSRVRRGTRTGRKNEGGRDNDELRTGRKIPVLKNADEAEVKESRTRPKSQADLSVAVFVHLTVTCVRSLVRFRRSTSRPFARVIPEGTTRDLGVLTPHSNSTPSLLAKLFFISTAPWLDARCDFYGTSPMSSRDKRWLVFLFISIHYTVYDV